MTHMDADDWPSQRKSPKLCATKRPEHKPCPRGSVCLSSISVCVSADQLRNTHPDTVCVCVSMQSLRFPCSGQQVTTVLNRVDLVPESIQHADLSAVNKHTVKVYLASFHLLLSAPDWTNDFPSLN